MLPQNAHKQLIVIDFEYANANLVGLEFANHFVSSYLWPAHAQTNNRRLNGAITTTT